MSIHIPEWVEKVNPFIWLVVIASILIIFSIVHDDKYISMWMLTFIYGILGFGIDAGFKEVNLRSAFLILLLLCYSVSFILLGISLTGVLVKKQRGVLSIIKDIDPGFNAGPGYVNPPPAPPVPVLQKN